MNKIGFIFSGIAVIIGIITLLTTTIVNKVMPQLGRVAFQTGMAGSYSPKSYHIDFGLVNTFSVAIIIAGVGLGYLFYRKETQI